MDMNHILVVDDEKAIVDLVVLNLEMSGYECDFALDGEDAVRKIDAGAYDLILLDIMLPKIDGVELMNYIRFLDIPVIFLTAKSAVKDRVAGLKLGAKDYLTKPFEIIELLARVETVLRRCRKIGQIYRMFDIELDMTYPRSDSNFLIARLSDSLRTGRDVYKRQPQPFIRIAFR